MFKSEFFVDIYANVRTFTDVSRDDARIHRAELSEQIYGDYYLNGDGIVYR